MMRALARACPIKARQCRFFATSINTQNKARTKQHRIGANRKNRFVPYDIWWPQGRNTTKAYRPAAIPAPVSEKPFNLISIPLILSRSAQR